MSFRLRICSSRLKPAVPRRWLLFMAGVLWTGAALLLLSRAVEWFVGTDPLPAAAAAAAGLLASLPAYRYGLRRAAGHNVRRIQGLPEMACLFAFSAWKGYLILAVMVATGILLRSSQLPRLLLAVPYTGMGGALLAGGMDLFRGWRRWPSTLVNGEA